MEFIIYEKPTYKITDAQHQSGYKYASNCVIEIINEIEKNDKCYHELLNKDKIIKFKVDIDGTDIELEEIDTSSAK